jgi:hypothetical protein
MSDEPGVAGNIAAEEIVARYIFSSSHFSRDNNRVKHNAFMPAPDGKTSVFRTKGLERDAVWEIGEQVARGRSQPLHARADITAGEVAQAKVKVALSEPPPRHCNIEGWPTEKSAQKLIAIDLADAARLILRP